MLFVNMISEAIRHGHELLIRYRGGGVRVVEPHTLGVGSKGQLLMRAYQTGGDSKSGETDKWKTFLVDEIDEVTDTGGASGPPRLGYRRNDPLMKSGIIAER